MFFYHFDPIYWENAYYESQWNVANSPRGIGDDGLYRYVGYRLVNNGENPFNINYEVPPLGKYTYGLTAKYLQNPYFTTFFYYIGSVFILYLISKQIFSAPYHWITTILFAANPMIVDEIQTTMLDLPLTFYFLLFLYFFIRYLYSKNYFVLYLSAISLGLMAGVKSPFFIPMIVIVSTIFIIKKGQFKKIPLFFVLVFSGYVLSYFCYFLKHPNPIPWLRLHEKIYNFLKNNGTSHDILNVFRYIFTSEYRGFWVNAKSYWPTNWSIILPIGVLSALFGAYKYLKKKILPDWLLFSILIVIFYLLMNLTMDFWPRYLVPLTPLLILISFYFFKKKLLISSFIFISYLPFLYLFFFPKPTEFISSFQNLYKSGFYKDTYQQLDTQTKNNFNLDQWQKLSSTTQPKDQNFKLVKEYNQWRINVSPNSIINK